MLHLVREMLSLFKADGTNVVSAENMQALYVGLHGVAKYLCLSPSSAIMEYIRVTLIGIDSRIKSKSLDQLIFDARDTEVVRGFLIEWEDDLTKIVAVSAPNPNNRYTKLI